MATMEPASTIISICGGFGAVAAMTGRSVIRVRRWTYSKDRGGSDGLIPADVAQVLLAAARQRGIDLTPDHFFPAWQPTAEDGQPTPSEDAA